MKVILLQAIGKLGKVGDTMEVKRGYARNYLFPKGFALVCTKENFKKLEEIKKRKIKLASKEKESFLALKEKLEKIPVTIIAKVKEEDEIYGSVGEQQILKSLKEEGIELNKGKIALEEPIRKLGVYNLKVDLCPGVEASLRVWVVKK
ncbi:MAG: 50S ribosomal protein L9 [Candidatus Omnitrophica bacterium]|nr:50S ribosomal protein L9 [Candidatus Omnitrophota bacterium]MBU0897107.1 50S ribosomal protein L9 [Candidatus Omnitrophota bacterium]MBU1134706.1 50S ribosomal protein L9 [Candidatus Omnitrophota bacterium]MBU1367528.1 50S ribosomal protein L9 [Candidatus Omnitrophota bacterium]MBU1523034.1 50S ribosomal protein L9 [Candidatus Omnitrophota bacterium]